MNENVFALQGNTALYDVLGVSATATDHEIRRAYHRLAVRYHPDKNIDGEAAFKEISFAYHILSDPEQRAMYDHDSLRQHLKKQARAFYDPAMDPSVELSPEALRQFVEKLGAAREAAAGATADFNRRREIELRRQAEWDATHGGLKHEYERVRRLQQPLATSAVRRDNAVRDDPPPLSHPTDVLPATPAASCGAQGTRTSAELMAMARDRECALASSSPAPAANPAASSSVRQQLLERFRRTYKREDYCADADVTHAQRRLSSARAGRARYPASTLRFVPGASSAPGYSDTIAAQLQRRGSFDYRGFVEKGQIDGGVMDVAILADALSQYSRTR